MRSRGKVIGRVRLSLLSMPLKSPAPVFKALVGVVNLENDESYLSFLADLS